MRICLTRSLYAAVCVMSYCAGAQAMVVNGDFSVNSLTNNTAQYQHVEGGWHSKNAGTNWAIQGEALVQIGNSGSATRAGQIFSADTLTGTGWFLNFDLTGDLTRVQLYGGLDDGNNSPTENALAFGGDGSPDNDIVVGSWTELINETGGLTTGARSFSITDDLSNFDLLAVRFRGTGATVGATIDNVEISMTAPPPPPPPVEGLVNGDFSDPTMKRGGNATYGDLGEGWVAKNAFDGDGGTPDNWQITGGELVQVGNNGSATRAVQIFRAGEMEGFGWRFEFELFDDNMTRLQVFAGLDDGNNLSGMNVLATGGDGTPASGAVVGNWATLIDEANLTPGLYSFDILEDLSQYDLIGVRFRGNGGTVGARIDNVRFIGPVTIPEPATATLALIGLTPLVLRRRRRRA